MTGWIISALIILFFMWTVFIYNRLITLRNDVKNSWHQIDVQLKRRHDLIPNLVSVVKGFMEFERDTLERVIAARSKALSANGMQARSAAEGMLTEALGRLYAVMENYPVLKSNENVLQLQEELASTENRIAFARQLYNDLVANFRTRLEVFPDNIIASLFAFQGEEYFTVEKDDRSVPAADVGTGK